MATFEHRKTELRALFESQKTLMKPWEWAPVAKALESYFPVRDAALQALIDVVADDGSELRRSQYESVLNDYLGRIWQKIGGMIDGLTDPSEGARLFREQVLVQECLFFNGLDDPDPCRTRDMLVTLEADLTKMIADLDAKWSKLKDGGRRVIDAELEATRAMETLLDDAIRTSAPLYERIGAAVGKVIEGLFKLGDDFNSFIVSSAKEYGERNPGTVDEAFAKEATEISKLGAATFTMAKAVGVPAATLAKALPFLVRDPGMVVSDTLLAGLPKDTQMLVTLLGEARKGLVYSLLGPYAGRVAQVKDALPFQGIMIASLSETRDDVARFMDHNGVEMARKLKELSEEAFDHWVSAQPQSGNHDDAADARVAMETPLQKRYDRLLSALGDFVGDWGGVFFGSLNSDARKVLLDQEEWDRQMGDLAGLGLEARLRVWKESVLTIDPRLGDAWTQVQSAFAGLPADLQHGLMQRVKAVWDPLAAAVREGASGAVADLDQTGRVAGDEQRRRDLDRSSALVKLPA